MKFFTKAWYEEMQVAGYMVFPETEQDWLEDVAWHEAEGISFEDRAKEELEYRKESLLKYLPDYFHASICDGTIKSAYPAPEFLERARQWRSDYDARAQALFKEYRSGYDAMKDRLPVQTVQLVENTLHDARVVSYAMPEEGVAEIILDCSGGYYYQCDIRLRFTGVSRISLPEPLAGKYWLYDEIYALEQGFELGVLMSYPPGELIITAQNVSIEMLGEPK